jgi:hypothetical protein
LHPHAVGDSQQKLFSAIGCTNDRRPKLNRKLTSAEVKNGIGRLEMDALDGKEDVIPRFYADEAAMTNRW